MICVHNKQYIHGTTLILSHPNYLSQCKDHVLLSSESPPAWKSLFFPPLLFSVKVIVYSPSSLDGLGTTMLSWFICSPSFSQVPPLSYTASHSHPFCLLYTFNLFMLGPSLACQAQSVFFSINDFKTSHSHMHTLVLDVTERWRLHARKHITTQSWIWSFYLTWDLLAPEAIFKYEKQSSG